MRTKVQVICIHAESDVELEERINTLCDDLSRADVDIINVSYAINSSKMYCLYAMIVCKYIIT